MKLDTLEILLHIQSVINLCEEKHRDAVDMFLSEYSDSTVGERKCHLQGHKYPLGQQYPKKPTTMQHQSVLLSISSDEVKEQSQVNTPKDVPLNSISDDEWSSDDE